MERREFAQLAAFGALSAWLPACADDASSLPGAPGSLQLTTGTTLQSFAPDGRAFAPSPFGNYVDFFSTSGAPIARIGSPSRAPTRALGDVNGPVAVAWDEVGQRLLVLEQGNARIQAFDAGGASLGIFASAVSGSDLFVHPGDGTVYLASTLNHRVDVFASNGRSLGTIGQFGTNAAGLNGPVSVALGADGALHVVDAGSALVKVFGADGPFVRSYGSGGIGSSALVGPRSVRVDGAGRVWVADTFGAAISVYDEQGGSLMRVSPTLPGGAPAAPRSLGVRADGAIYAALIAAG
jgi:DNA-binding beta-propeller fold protein YncE